MEELLMNFGLSPAWVAVLVAAVILLERLGKLIPDSATGALGILRKVAKLLSGYVENKK